MAIIILLKGSNYASELGRLWSFISEGCQGGYNRGAGRDGEEEEVLGGGGAGGAGQKKRQGSGHQQIGFAYQKRWSAQIPRLRQNVHINIDK